MDGDVRTGVVGGREADPPRKQVGGLRPRAGRAHLRGAAGSPPDGPVSSAPRACDRPTFVSSFVTWNVGRGAEAKSSAIEELIREAGHPAFIALQEIGDARIDNSTLAAVLLRHDYVGFARHRADENSRGHGGVALLVRKEICAQPHVWAEADAWSTECEAVSVRVTPHDAPPFVVTSWYVHGASTDVAGFNRVLNSARDDQVILGDLNAQLPGSRRGGSVIAHNFAQRGIHLDNFIRERGWMYPTPTGPTRRARTVSDGKTVQVDGEGTINDHILVGCDVFDHI
jgi:hypothetical protein